MNNTVADDIKDDIEEVKIGSAIISSRMFDKTTVKDEEKIILKQNILISCCTKLLLLR